MMVNEPPEAAMPRSPRIQGQGRNPRRRIHQPGQKTPWNNQKPASNASEPSPHAARYDTDFVNTAVTIQASISTAASESPTATA